MVSLGLGWDAVLIGAATVAAVASLVVGADRRISADSPAPPRILYSYGCICAGIGSFSLGQNFGPLLSLCETDGSIRQVGFWSFRIPRVAGVVM